MGKIAVALYRVGRPVSMEDIDDTLETYQGIVGGYIQAVELNDDGLTLVCNEEGKLCGLPGNARVRFSRGDEDIICGDFFLCRTEECDFASLSPENIKQIPGVVFG